MNGAKLTVLPHNVVAFRLATTSSVVVIVIIVRHEELIFLEEGRHLFADPSADADSREDGGEELEEAESRRRLRFLYQRPRIERGAGPRLLFQ